MTKRQVWQIRALMVALIVVGVVASNLVKPPVSAPVAFLLVLPLIVGVVGGLLSLMLRTSEQTQRDHIASLRSKVAWGVWAAQELEKLGIDPFEKP